jgi:tetratricopeptide (TPR) repeat protein
MPARYALVALALCAGLAAADHGLVNGKAPLLADLGSRHHKITTSSEDAQRYFDQGVTLCWAFNHPEAIRSFQRVAKLDPDCAMARWGLAFAYGPNINAPMGEDVNPKAYAAAQKALELAPRASPKEQAYIRAMATRYAEKPPKDRGALDRAFADAMREVHTAYPDDLDAAVLFAESLMDTMPWNYWAEDGKPRPGTAEMIEVLEKALKADPLHPGANHYYVHAVEASPTPERGLAAAHRLRDLVPGSGHLVHMPSHIYLRVGQYHEASVCNERAIAADEAYIAKYKITGMYAAMYYPHNVHFLSYSTGLEGRKADSLRAARKLGDMVTDEALKLMPEAQWFKATTYLAPARLGEWEAVLREPAPADDHLFLRATYHYARGLAHLRRKELPEAEAELAMLETAAADERVKKLEVPSFPGPAIIAVYGTVLRAEVGGVRGKACDLTKGLHEAVRLQDKLPYMEPPYFYMPLRHRLAAALAETEQWDDAEAVLREDLKRNPENGWSLFGLLQCQRAAGRFATTVDTERRLRDAWKHAHVTLTAAAP